jgi:hypothetical protein
MIARWWTIEIWNKNRAQEDEVLVWEKEIFKKKKYRDFMCQEFVHICFLNRNSHDIFYGKGNQI